MSCVRPVAFIFRFPPSLQWLWKCPCSLKNSHCKNHHRTVQVWVYFLSFPSPSFFIWTHKARSVVEFTSLANFRDGFLTKKHILQFGAILVFVPQFFSPYLSSLSFCSSSHSVCLPDFFTFLGFATALTNSFSFHHWCFLVTCAQPCDPWREKVLHWALSGELNPVLK